MYILGWHHLFANYPIIGYMYLFAVSQPKFTDMIPVMVVNGFEISISIYTKPKLMYECVIGCFMWKLYFVIVIKTDLI